MTTNETLETLVRRRVLADALLVYAPAERIEREIIEYCAEVAASVVRAYEAGRAMARNDVAAHAHLALKRLEATPVAESRVCPICHGSGDDCGASGGYRSGG